MNKVKSLLLAEDDCNVAELMLLALEEVGLAVEAVVVGDGVEALDYLFGRGRYCDAGSGAPSVVLLDLNMPKVGGLEVLRQIREDERLSRTPVVILTSSRDAGDIESCYEQGANAYIVKPIDFQKFKSTIQQVGNFWAAINEPPPPPAKPVVRSLSA